MLKVAAIIYGIVFLLVGILGFVPGITMYTGMTPHREMLLGIFHVNILHNIVHLLTGIVAFWAALTSFRACQLYFKIFGVIYLIVAILGFFYGDRHIFGVLANNMADSWLHLIIAAISLYLGFGEKSYRR